MQEAHCTTQGRREDNVTLTWNANRVIKWFEAGAARPEDGPLSLPHQPFSSLWN